MPGKQTGNAGVYAQQIVTMLLKNETKHLTDGQEPFREVLSLARTLKWRCPSEFWNDTGKIPKVHSYRTGLLWINSTRPMAKP